MQQHPKKANAMPKNRERELALQGDSAVERVTASCSCSGYLIQPWSQLDVYY